MKTPNSLTDDARQIWQAGVDAVRSEQLVSNVIRCDQNELSVCGHKFPWSQLNRIAVIGAGKAGAGMAAAVESSVPDSQKEKLFGWVNVPADCVRQLDRIHLHAGRPAGVNEPTEEGVKGCRKMLEMIGQLDDRDLCLVLMSGGGSALMPSPSPPLTLNDKLLTTRFLMNHGAEIQQLNSVRKRLSNIKGGKLARASRAGTTIAMIISDIVGDPLDMIASGPTVDDPTTDAEALEVLERYNAKPPEVPESVFSFLESKIESAQSTEPFPGNVFNHIIGNNASAMDAAKRKADELGYEVISLGSNNAGIACEEGRMLALRAMETRNQDNRRPTCLLSGGEPIVNLAETDEPRRGGRNQELVLAALQALIDEGMQGIAILSGGTDGEDGPTDAAGAWANADLLEATLARKIPIERFLAINDSYTFFEQVGGLLKTGPTHTNVMDLRVAIVDAESSQN